MARHVLCRVNFVVQYELYRFHSGMFRDGVIFVLCLLHSNIKEDEKDR